MQEYELSVKRNGLNQSKMHNIKKTGIDLKY